ncbi:MAG: SagB/ThcOx family dehydrogenase [Pseudonocardiales bacterium]|nr:SagB/ThcOx family dehydrogenase [Pseudonocardiales bacterium]
MTQILPRRAALGEAASPNQDTDRRGDLAALYHEHSKLHALPGQQVASTDMYSSAEIAAMSRGHKRYRRAPVTPLPTDPPLAHREFAELVARRRTVRHFGDQPLECASLAAVLQLTYGITGSVSGQGHTQPLRAAPSAGGLYPGELYLGIRSVTGIAPGLYHYQVIGHELELLRAGDLTDEYYRVCCQQDGARTAAVILFIGAVVERTRRKYGLRGYRYALLDIGHLAQNFSLACTALDLAAMTTCGFYDDDVNSLLRLDGVDETIMYVGFFGTRAEGPAPPPPSRQTFMRAEYGS